MERCCSSKNSFHDSVNFRNVGVDLCWAAAGVVDSVVVAECLGSQPAVLRPD